MKQSKKLLSLILALVMICSVVTVGAQASSLRSTKITQSTVTYDSVDHAVLTPEQVATIIDDQIDVLLAQQNIIVDTKIAGKINLTSLNSAFSSLYSVLGNILIGSGTVGDVYSFKENKSYLNGYTRESSGDLVMLRQFIGFITQGNAPDSISKIAYGIGSGTNQFSLGLVGGFVSVDQLNDIPGMVKEKLFNALLQGSYTYPNEYAKTTGASSMTADGIVNTALFNMLTTPQDYTTAADGTKTWDTNSIMSKTLKNMSATTAKALVNVNSNSFLHLLDNVAQIAFNEYAPAALGGDVKKALMGSTGCDLVEITDADTIAAITASMPTSTSYFTHTVMWKVNGVWYLKKAVSSDSGADVYKYYREDATGANAFYNMVNWDFAFTSDSINFSQLLTDYGSYFGALNHLLYIALNTMVKDSVKTDMANVVGSFWTDGHNTELNANILKTAKYILQAAPTTIFGRNSQFSSLTYNDIKDLDMESLVAYIAIPFLKDGMPQLLMPASLDNGLQIEEIGALVLRDVLSKCAPNVNYDSQIFTADSLTSGTRVLQTKTSNEWFDLMLNMGLDLGYTYLDNSTSFNFTAEQANAKNWTWQAKVEEVVEWAIDNYLSGILTIGGSKITLASLGETRGTYDGKGINTLNKILNGLLPLGFICNSDTAQRSGLTGDDAEWAYTSGTTYTFDAMTALYKVKKAVCNLDFEQLLSFTGRSSASFNVLSSYNLVETILRVLAQVLNCVVPGALGTAYTTGTNANLTALTSQAGLKSIINTLLIQLGTYVYSSGNTSGLLWSKLLPLIAAFNSDWTGEQTFGSPAIGLEPSIITTNGAASGLTFTVTNGSKGVWRHYKDASGTAHLDNQYKYKLTGVTAVKADGTTCSNVTVNSYTTTDLDYGGSGTVTYAISGLPAAGAVVRFIISYKVYDEDGTLGSKVYTASKYTYLSYNGEITSIGQTNLCTGSKAGCKIDIFPFYAVATSDVSTISTLPVYYYYKEKTNTWLVNDYNNSMVLTPTPTTQSGVGVAALNINDKLAYDTTVNYSYNAATFAAANVAPGTTLTWSLYGNIRNNEAVKTLPVSILIYSLDGQADLRKLADDEATRVRIAGDYNTTDCYANKVLTADESNFTAQGIDPNGQTVTVINGAIAWTNYVAAFNTAYRLAHEYVNPNWAGGIAAAATALKKAANDLEFCKKTSAQMASGGDSIDSAVVSLKSSLDTIETNLTGKGFTDYKAYRWDRYTSSRSDAERVISLYNRSQLTAADLSYFPYTDIGVAALNTLVASDSQKDYITALLTAYSTDEQAENAKNLAKDKVDYAGYTSADVAQISNMLTRNSNRLLTRSSSPYTAYLSNDIASAIAAVGTANTNGVYTARSWAAYASALAAAQSVVAGTSQSPMYSAQYDLDAARNGLITVASGAEADYTQLDALITQAQYVLSNVTLYNNTNAEFGAVLAALGDHEFTDAAGKQVQLFPDSALVVDANSYSDMDQRKIDKASDALKAALAKMKFTAAAATPADDSEVTPTPIVVDQENNITALVATIPQKILPADINTKIGLKDNDSAEGLTSEVSNDNSFSMTHNSVLAGTGATVTYFKTVNSVKLPVATYKIVVKGDVNGDGVVDAMDCMATALVSCGNGAFSGCYYLAGNTVISDPGITTEDYADVVNRALGIVVN